MEKHADWQVVITAEKWVEEVDCNSGRRRRVYRDGQVQELIDTTKHGAQKLVAENAGVTTQQVKDLLEVTLHYKEWIAALPDEVVATLPAMPGIDGDWADEVIYSVQAALSAKAQE